MVEQTTESAHPSVPVTEISAGLPSTWHRIWDSDVFYSFRASKVTMVAAFVTFMIFFLAMRQGRRSTRTSWPRD